MKTALITGCNRELGARIRDILLKEGYISKNENVQIAKGDLSLRKYKK